MAAAASLAPPSSTLPIPGEGAAPFGPEDPSSSPLEKIRGLQLAQPADTDLLANYRSLNPPSAPLRKGVKLAPAEQSLPSPPQQLQSGFREAGLGEELLAAVDALGLKDPTEIQARGIPEVLQGRDVILASHTGSGKTLAYLMPIVQMLRKDEQESGESTRPRRPRALVLCPTRELAEQVLQVAKSLCHHARFRSAMIGGGSRLKPQVDALATPLDVVVGTPGRLVQHLKDRHFFLRDVRYLVIDEADTMFDRGFGPEVRRLLAPLRSRSQLPGDPGFTSVLVTATITKAVQRLLEEEFRGVHHVKTSTLHKRVSTARHDFLEVAGSENKLDALLQVLEPSLDKGQRAMIFCNTVQSCRAADHFLAENGIETLNYHGEVPADERVENLEQFRETFDGRGGGEEAAGRRTGGGRPPALVCTDLAARGLDLVVDHVIMFDFPQNPIDYLHRTGRTARMGAKGVGKGRITSLVTRRDQFLASQIEAAIAQGEPLEGLTADREKVEAGRRRDAEERRREEFQRQRKAGLRGAFRPPSGPPRAGAGGKVGPPNRGPLGGGTRGSAAAGGGAARGQRAGTSGRQGGRRGALGGAPLATRGAAKRGGVRR